VFNVGSLQAIHPLVTKTNTYDGAGQNRPYLFLLKIFFIDCSSVDLFGQVIQRILPHGKNFEKCGA
jgi:hypothetical protein